MAIIVKRKLQPRLMAEQIAERVIGPVVNRWLLALHQYISYLDDSDTEFLFCARAGVRIKKLYDAHIGTTSGGEGTGKLFWSSRVGACKGVFRRFSSGASEILTKEYRHDSLEQMIRGVLRNQPDLADLINYSGPEFQARGEKFTQWLRAGTTDARIVINYLDRCGIAFDQYLSELIGGKKKCVLIDSGWQGTAQWLLSNAYPEIEWKGLYFGRIMSTARDPNFVDHIIGLMFEADQYNPNQPITAVTHFHHLIEMLLEVAGPSIEEIPAGQFKAIARKQISANQRASEQDEENPVFKGVLAHIRRSTEAAASISQIISAYENALPEFERLILFPTRAEALALGSGHRSADFGKSLKIPVLRLAAEHEEEAGEDRIERSLWRQGQIALEIDKDWAEQQQSQLIGYSAATLCDLRTSQVQREGVDSSVAIITRTKNRPVLLRRAAESVASQTHRNYVWVIVNDGGDIGQVTDVIDACPVERHKIILINNRTSRGMEAASNLGIRNSESTFLVIHDDDDSWSPDFLEKTVEFLTSPQGKPYGGVISKSVYVSEEVSGNKVIEHARAPYQDWVRNVHLAEMARENFFPPIAFVFHRRLYTEIGGYNEELPVLGDWFFNMEFLLKADIGVIRSTTAYYHHRDVGPAGGAYSNSVIGGISKHEEYASIARNKFLRKHGANNIAAYTAVTGYFAQETKRLEHKLDGRASGGSPGPVNWNAEEGLNYEALEAEFDRQWLVNQLNAGFVFSLVSNLTEYKQTMVDVGAPLDDLVSTVMGRSIPVQSPPNFNEEAYLNRYTDVAEACRGGDLPSGYLHYLAYGRAEGRKRFRQ